MTTFLEQLKVELKLYFRNRVAIFWAFVFPVAAILGLGYIFNPSGELSLPVGVVDHDSTDASRTYLDYLRDQSILKLSPGSQADLEQKLKDNELFAVLILKEGFEENIGSKSASLEIRYNPYQPQNIQLLFTLLGEANTGYDVSREEYKPSIEMVKSPVEKIEGNKRYVDFLVPGMIGFSIMSASLFGVGLVLISHRERGNLKRLAVTPLRKSTFISATITQRLLIISMQAAAMVFTAWIAFDVVNSGGWPDFSFSVLASMLTFISIGFVIASVSKTIEVAQGITQVLFLAMTFLSGAFFPVDNLPGLVKPLIQLLPLTHCINLMRGIFVGGHSLFEHGYEIVILIGWTVVCFFISKRLFRWTV